MTQAQQRMFQTLRTSGWSGVRIPTGPDQPRGGPMIMVNGKADVIYILPSGTLLLLKDTVQYAEEALRRSGTALRNYPLQVYTYNLDRLADLMEVLKSEPPYNR